MARQLESGRKRSRISIEVDPHSLSCVQQAAAKQGVTIRQYVVDAIADRLYGELVDKDRAKDVLTARTDPVLAELWDNPFDARYDQL